LSSEYIYLVNKKKIFIWVRNKVDKILNADKNFEQFRQERSQIISKLQRRAL